MELVTIQQIRFGYASTKALIVYVVEGEGCVMYVGKSRDAITRMESHLGIGEWAGFFGSSFDQMLVSNPKTGSYTVKFYDEDDIAGTVAGSFALDVKVSMFEEALIDELQPVFNVMGRKRHSRHADVWYGLHPDPIIEPIIDMQRGGG